MHSEHLLEQFDAKEYISNFQIDLFSTCPASYFYFYMLQQEKGGNAVTTFGDCVHTTIERIGNKAIQEYDGYISKISYQEVIDTFMSVVEKFPGIISIENINRAKFQLNYWYTMAIERDCRVLAVEIPFHLYLPNGTAIKGFIDWEETNKFTGPNEVQFADWKTGYISKDYTNQMTLYKIAGLFLRPNKQVTTVLHEFQHESFEVYSIDKKDMEDYYQFVEVIKNAINAFVAQINVLLDQGDAKALKAFLDSVAKTHVYCYSCNGSTSCGIYRRELYGFTGMDINNLNLNQLALQEKKAKEVAKWAKETVEKIKKAFVDQLLKNDMQSIPLETGEYINSSVSSRKYISSDKVIPILVKHGYYNKLTISMTTLEDIIPKLPPADQEIIKKNIFKSVGNQSYRISKKPKSPV